MNSGDDLDVKYTFIGGVKNPHSCTFLVKGSNDHSFAHFKDAIRDGLRAVRGVHVGDDRRRRCLFGSHVHFEHFKRTVPGKPHLGFEMFLPKDVSENSGVDVQDKLLVDRTPIDPPSKASSTTSASRGKRFALHQYCRSRFCL